MSASEGCYYRGGGHGQPDEYESEMDGAIKRRNDQHLVHATGRGLQEGQLHDGEDEKTLPPERQRWHLLHADLGRNEIEAPDRAVQVHEGEMSGSRGVDADGRRFAVESTGRRRNVRTPRACVNAYLTSIVPVIRGCTLQKK